MFMIYERRGPLGVPIFFAILYARGPLGGAPVGGGFGDESDGGGCGGISVPILRRVWGRISGSRRGRRADLQ